jgi:hypothetical protein
MYDEKRYFTFTGDVGMGVPKSVEKRVAELKDVHAEYIQDEEGSDEDATDGASAAAESDEGDTSADS